MVGGEGGVKMNKAVILVFLVLCSSAVLAFVPDRMSYQGYLRSSVDGSPVSAVKVMNFTIYDSLTGGSQLWSSGNVSVVVDRGLFSFELANLGLSGSQVYYLERRIGGELIVPRANITQVMWAQRAQIANNLSEGNSYVVGNFSVNDNLSVGGFGFFGDDAVFGGNVSVVGNVSAGFDSIFGNPSGANPAYVKVYEEVVSTGGLTVHYPTIRGYSYLEELGGIAFPGLSVYGGLTITNEAGLIGGGGAISWSETAGATYDSVTITPEFNYGGSGRNRLVVDDDFQVDGILTAGTFNPDSLTVGNGADTDIVVTFDGGSSDGTVTYESDNSVFVFSEPVGLQSGDWVGTTSDHGVKFVDDNDVGIEINNYGIPNAGYQGVKQSHLGSQIPASGFVHTWINMLDPGQVASISAFGNLTLGSSTTTTDTDVSLTMQGKDNSFLMSYDQSADLLTMSDNIKISAANYLYFRDTDTYVRSPSSGSLNIGTQGTLSLLSATINLNAPGSGQDTVMTWQGNTHSGVLTWMEDEGRFDIIGAGNMTVNVNVTGNVTVSDVVRLVANVTARCNAASDDGILFKDSTDGELYYCDGGTPEQLST